MVLIVGLGSGCVRCRWREHRCETTAPAGVSRPPHPPPSPRRRLGQGVLWFSHLQGHHGLQAPHEPQALRGSSSALQHPELWAQVLGGGDTCDPGRWQAKVGEGHGSLAWAERAPHRHFGSLKGTRLIKVNAEGRQELAYLGG